MKKLWMALLLVPVLILSLGLVSAVAGEEAGGGLLIAPNPNHGAVETVSYAGPDEKVAAETKLDEETEKLIVQVTTKPEALESLSFEKLEKQLRSGNLSLLALEENIVMLETMDYKELEEDLRDTLNMISDAQWAMHSGSMYVPEYGMNVPVEYDALAYNQMEQQYAALEAQFDAIYKGELQEDNAGLIRQLNSLEDQIVMGGETLYMALVAMERQEASLQRQLESLNRTVEEMELRYQMGQISSLQLSEVKAGRTSLVSGLNTLQMTIKTYKMQLESMLGTAMTGEIRLGTVPAVSDEELERMDVEKDLLTAKARSYQLYAAAKDLEEAKETYDDEADKYNYNEEKTLYRKAKHTWQAAQYTYNDVIRGFELKFRTLHAQVQDYKQILESTKVSLENEKLSFAAAELKQSQGTISQNAYLTAKDDLQAAEDAVQKAAEDLFSAYNTYCWAVEHGIVN